MPGPSSAEGIVPLVRRLLKAVSTVPSSKDAFLASLAAAGAPEPSAVNDVSGGRYAVSLPLTAPLPALAELERTFGTPRPVRLLHGDEPPEVTWDLPGEHGCRVVLTAELDPEAGPERRVSHLRFTPYTP